MARYIVNAGGIIHSVNDAEYAVHLAVARQTAMQRTRTPDSAPLSEGDVNAPMPREATPDEIMRFWAAQGLVYDPATGEAHPKGHAALQAALADPSASSDETTDPTAASESSKARGK